PENTHLSAQVRKFREEPSECDLRGAHIDGWDAAVLISDIPARTSSAGVPGSPRSQYKPVMIRSPSSRISGGKCSFGACCEQPGYECGTHIVRSPKTSVNTSFGKEPPRFGKIAGFLPLVLAMDWTAH